MKPRDLFFPKRHMVDVAINDCWNIKTNLCNPIWTGWMRVWGGARCPAWTPKANNILPLHKPHVEEERVAFHSTAHIHASKYGIS